MNERRPRGPPAWRSRAGGAIAAVTLMVGGGLGATATWATESAPHHADRSDSAKLQRLTDTEDIRRLKARYFRYIDSKEWSKLAALFTAHPAIDVGAKYDSGKELAENTAKLLGAAPTAHQGFLPEITVNGDRASAIWGHGGLREFPAWLQLQRVIPRLR
ncbi:nuclear transport factor 2 family protein [Streptomyces sp. NPDC006475]|uniref:nuclear transport factor 2 family protein n=1 Tax=Streptomyces sp. NPDC006475 TaxID=3155719 RepID=UPI0033A79663